MTTEAELVSQLRALGIPDWDTARWLLDEAAKRIESQAAEIERLGRIAAEGVKRQQRRLVELRDEVTRLRAIKDDAWEAAKGERKRLDAENTKLREAVRVGLEALEKVARGHHDPMPTRLLPRGDAEIAIDTWWQRYYTSNDEQHKRIAKEAIATMKGVLT